MSVTNEIADLRRQIDALKLERERLQERLRGEIEERDRLLVEAEALGISDPSKISEWVEKHREEFETAKERVRLKLIEARSNNA